MLIPDFSGIRLLVVGDVMVDEYIDGTAERLSPEAPVAVVNHTGNRFYPGGAANVANNAAALGANIMLTGVVGTDGFWSLCGEQKFENRLILDTKRPTTMKTRIMANGSQVLRLDSEDPSPISGTVEDSLIKQIERSSGPIIVSDYAKGVVTERVFKACLSIGKPVFVGAKQHLRFYKGANWIVLNNRELGRFTDGQTETGEQIRDRCFTANYETGADFLVTCGADGIVMWSKESTGAIHSTAREVFDVSGAGDTVLATFACAITAGMKPLEAAQLANAAAGIVVGKRGTATVSREELQAAVGVNFPIFIPASERTEPDSAAIVHTVGWKEPNPSKIIGFANGCFDLLHAGHISLLERARAQCDYLIVAINDDASVRRLKGEGRPVWNDIKRAAKLRALPCVDTVLTFHENTPLSLIELLHPKVIFRGEEGYLADDVVGGREVRSWGGKVVFLPKLEGYSTTAIIAAQIP